MIKESKVYVCKSIKLPKPFRGLVFVVKEKEWYRQTSLGIFWRKSVGLGVKGEPLKVFKYFMFGINLVRINIFAEIRWIGKNK